MQIIVYFYQNKSCEYDKLYFIKNYFSLLNFSVGTILKIKELGENINDCLMPTFYFMLLIK